MRAHLTRDQLWNGNFYLAGDRDIPDDLAIALGLQPESKSATVADLKSATVADLLPHPLLVFLNRAEASAELEVLPAVGKGAAARLLANRPVDGYESLEEVAALNDSLTQPPFRVDWEQLKDWANVHGSG